MNSVGSNSQEAAAFAKVLEQEANNAAEAQTGNYLQQEIAPGAENNSKVSAFYNNEKSIQADTCQFETPDALAAHFKKHGEEFGYTSQDEYLLKANVLINSGDSAVLIKYRANGDKLCYNPKTNEFAVVTKNGIIRTYFKPKYGIDYFNNL